MPTWIVHGVDSDVYGSQSPQRRGAPDQQRRAPDRRPSALAPVLEDGPQQSAGDALTALAEIQYNADELSQQVLFKP